MLRMYSIARLILALILVSLGGLSPFRSAHSTESLRSCRTAGEAAKCGPAERCVDNPDPEQLALQRWLNKEFGKAEPLNIAECIADLDASLNATNCAGRKLHNGPCIYSLTGEITHSTAEALERFLLANPDPPPGLPFITMRLNSVGGDIAAAMRIGALMRNKQADMFVGPNSVCASACALVLAGGVDRQISGPVVIHRPYRSEAVVLGAKEAQRQYSLSNTQIRTYLQRMNVSPSLLDAMLAIPPEDGRRLTASELKSYGLDGADPAFAEEQDAAIAKMRGLSMTEYLQEKRTYNDCRDAYNWSPESIGKCRAVR